LNKSLLCVRSVGELGEESGMSNKLPTSEPVLATASATEVFEGCAPGLHFLTVIELEILAYASRVKKRFSDDF
jgi:hypothetical protein